MAHAAAFGAAPTNPYSGPPTSRQTFVIMLQNNALLAQLKQQIRSTTPRVEGVIKATEKGFGFLETDEGDSYFVPPPAMKQVLHGDRVEAVLHEEGDKKSVEPDTLIEPGLERFIARVQKREGRLAVVPDHPSIRNARSRRASSAASTRRASPTATGWWPAWSAIPSSPTTAPSSPRSTSWWPRPTTRRCRGA